MPVVTILDYGAGNVCSLRNAVHKLGYETKDVHSVADIDDAQVLIFPGVGAFGHAMEVLHERGYVEALKAYITADRPFFGICIGFQVRGDHVLPRKHPHHIISLARSAVIMPCDRPALIWIFSIASAVLPLPIVSPS